MAAGLPAPTDPAHTEAVTQDQGDGSGAVDAAFTAVPRRGFLPDAQQRHADLNVPLDIGLGQTSSQPTTVRSMLGLLDVRAGQHILDVGAGSGWTTALLAHLVGPEGSVVGVELEPTLAAWGRTNVEAAHLPWARVETAVQGRLGWPAEAPYDRILVSAEASEVPPELVGQLAEAAVMVLPVSGQLVRLSTVAGQPPVVERLGRYRFVPLRERIPPPERS